MEPAIVCYCPEIIKACTYTLALSGQQAIWVIICWLRTVSVILRENFSFSHHHVLTPDSRCEENLHLTHLDDSPFLFSL